MKRTNIFFIILTTAILFTSCSKPDSYSFFRSFFPNSYITKKGSELETVSPSDRNLKDQYGAEIESAYFAIVEGEFTNIGDSIIQHGHCWSITNPNPYLNINDTAHYSNLGAFNMSENMTFVSNIGNLFPETPFYVRSYIITNKLDTGYNQTVFCDTTLSPIDQWFITNPVGSYGRQGSVSFSMISTLDNKEYGYVGLGKDAGSCYGDFWRYDPEAETWSQIDGIASRRTEAVAISITYSDKNGKPETKAYMGTGEDFSGNNKYDDWLEYNEFANKWEPTTSYASFPKELSSAVAFSIGNKGYVGTGSSSNNIQLSTFYEFNPLSADSIGGKPWKTIADIGNNTQYRRDNAVAFVISDRGFVGTGELNGEYYDDLWMFIPPEGLNNAYWIKRTDFPAPPRTEAVGFNIEQQGYVGLGYNGTNIRDFYRYDPYNDVWFECANYKFGPHLDPEIHVQYVRNATGFSIGDKGYVGTGYHGENEYPKYSNEFWVYRPW